MLLQLFFHYLTTGNMILNDANLYRINYKVEKAGGNKIQETYLCQEMHKMQ